MEPREFLFDLQSIIGGEVAGGGASFPGPHRLAATRNGHRVVLDFVRSWQVRIDVVTPPPHRLRVRHQSVSRQDFGAPDLMSCDAKTGDQEFDSEYVIDSNDADWAMFALSPQVRQLMGDLDELAFLELTDVSYRCLKEFCIGHYQPRQAVRDIETMIKIAEHVQAAAEAGSE